MKSKGITKQAVEGFGAILVLGAFLVGVFSSASIAIAADKYPTKPVTLLVPFSPGGSTDLPGRIYASNISKYLGQPMIVENRSNSPQGIMEVEQSIPDGYTVGFWGTGLCIYRHLLPVYPEPSNFEPVAQLTGVPRCIAVSSASSFKNIQELIAWAKKNPKKLLVGINPGATSHLETAHIMNTMGIEPNYIPFKSGGERVVALAGGHIQLSVDAATTFRSYVDAKKVRILGITSQERDEMNKEIPTLIEQGVNLVAISRQGLFVPKKVPAEVIQVIEAAFEKTAKDEKTIEQFRKMNDRPAFLNRKEFKQFIDEECSRITDLVQQLGLTKKK